MNNQRLIDLLTSQNAEIVAKEILSTFIESGNEENIEIDYRITAGTASSCEKNTIFKFNFDKDKHPVLTEISEIAKKIEDISDSGHDAMLNFEKMTKKEIEENHFDTIKAKLREFTPLDHNKMSAINPETRKQILKTLFPMKESSIVSCEFNLFFEPNGDSGYTLTINKNSPRRGTSTTAVANDLQKRSKETGQTFEEIIAERKKAGDDQYKYVVGVERKYYEFNCQLSFHIDYTPAPKDKVDKEMAKIL